jgi:polar amino acid transport system substrate-binding protein
MWSRRLVIVSLVLTLTVVTCGSATDHRATKEVLETVVTQLTDSPQTTTLPTGAPATPVETEAPSATDTPAATEEPSALATPREDLLDQVMAAGKLVVSTDPDYPPQSFTDEAGELAGFDVDVAREVARRLGVGIEFESPDWDMITAGHWGGRWDVSIGSMTPTEARAEVLWFTDPYYFTPASFAVHTDNTTIQTSDDLVGKTVGLGTATTYEDYLKGTLSIMGGEVAYDPPPDVKIRPYLTDAYAFEDMKLGDGARMDAVMSAQLTIQEAINDGYPLKFVGTPAFYEPLVFALDKAGGSTDKMLLELNAIIAAMHEDGTLTNLSLKWYGIDITRLVKPEQTEP